MAQVNRSPKVYDVCIVGSGAGRRNRGQDSHRGRPERGDAGSGRAVEPGSGLQRARLALRIGAPRGRCGRARAGAGQRNGERIYRAHWCLDDRRRALLVGPRIEFSLVPVAHRGRTNQPLGPDCASLRPGGFQVQDARRAGRRLANHATKTSLPTTTRWSPTSGCSAARKIFPALPTAYSSHHQNHDATNWW